MDVLLLHINSHNGRAQGRRDSGVPWSALLARTVCRQHKPARVSPPPSNGSFSVASHGNLRGTGRISQDLGNHAPENPDSYIKMTETLCATSYGGEHKPTRATIEPRYFEFSREKGSRRKAEIPLGFDMVPKAGFEPARVSPTPSHNFGPMVRVFTKWYKLHGEKVLTKKQLDRIFQKIPGQDSATSVRTSCSSLRSLPSGACRRPPWRLVSPPGFPMQGTPAVENLLSRGRGSCSSAETTNSVAIPGRLCIRPSLASSDVASRPCPGSRKGKGLKRVNLLRPCCLHGSPNVPLY